MDISSLGYAAARDRHMMDRNSLIQRFLFSVGWGNAQRVQIAGDASNRTYDRLERSTGETAILMDAPIERGEDVRPFVRIAEHLRHEGFSAPEILGQDPRNGLLLIEDFGDGLFARLIADDPDRQDDLYALACDVLVAVRDIPKMDLPLCDANWLVDMLEPVFDWYALESHKTAQDQFVAAFRPLAEKVAQAGTVLSLRDYHVENLILLPDREAVAQVGLLDFQDATLAHPAYDLVSVLQDARRDVPPKLEAEMLNRYLARTNESPAAFREAYALIGLQRNLRIVGVFARLCLRDGKPDYLDKIPRVWGYVQRNLKHPSLQPLAPLLAACLPEPTTSHLNEIRRACRPNLSQP